LQTLEDLEKNSVIQISRDREDRILSIDISPLERQCGRENYDFYCFLIWPFIESFWLAAVFLMALTPPAEQSKDAWLDFARVHSTAQLVRCGPSHYSPPEFPLLLPER
jgi:hypothetical protein